MRVAARGVCGVEPGVATRAWPGLGRVLIHQRQPSTESTDTAEPAMHVSSSFPHDAAYAHVASPLTLSRALCGLAVRGSRPRLHPG